jgi:hypothetical protein
VDQFDPSGVNRRESSIVSEVHYMPVTIIWKGRSAKAYKPNGIAPLDQFFTLL